MKKLFFIIFMFGCSYESKPKTIADCPPTTPQSLEAQPRESFCYTINFISR